MSSEWLCDKCFKDLEGLEGMELAEAPMMNMINSSCIVCYNLGKHHTHISREQVMMLQEELTEDLKCLKK